MFVRSFLVLLACSACDAECIQVQQLRTGSVEVTAFDIRGVILESVEADLLDARTLKKLYSAQHGHFNQVQYGDYRVRVWARGFYSVEVPVRLDQPNLAVRAQLAVGVECRVFSSLIGTVASSKPIGGLWVKVIPAYGSGGLEAPMGPSGFFLASGLESGQYLVVVMDGVAPIHSEVVTVSGETKLKIDLPNALPPPRSTVH